MHAHPRTFRTVGQYCLALGLGICVLLGQNLAAEEISFRRDIAPILLDNCVACHGAKKAEGGYRVDSYELLVKAGDSGESPIAEPPEQPGELLRRITCQEESERMPAESDALASEQIDLIRNWLAAGAQFDGPDASLTLSLVIPAARYADPPSAYPRAVPIKAILFSPDGKQIVAGGYHELTVWNEDSKLVRRIGNVGQRVFALAFASDGVTLAVCCGEPGRSGEVRLVNYETGEVSAVLARASDVTLDVAFRPGTSEVAIASADGLIKILDTTTQNEIRTIASHADWVTSVAWSEDGSRLASASRDKSAKIYDAATGELLASYLGHGTAVHSVCFLEDGKQIVSSGNDNKVHRWNIEDSKKIAEVGLGGEGFDLVRRGNDLFVPCSNQRLVRIDLSENKVSHEYQGHADWVFSAALSPPKKDASNHYFLASGAFDGEVRLWNLSDDSFVRGWIAKP